MTEQDERAATSEQKSIDDQLRTVARFNRMEDQYVTTRQLDDKCRGCHTVDNLKHDEATTASNRLALAIEKLDARLDKITEELQSRLPKWASVGGIVTFSLLTGTIGYLAKAAGIG